MSSFGKSAAYVAMLRWVWGKHVCFADMGQVRSCVPTKEPLKVGEVEVVDGRVVFIDRGPRDVDAFFSGTYRPAGATLAEMVAHFRKVFPDVKPVRDWQHVK